MRPPSQSRRVLPAIVAIAVACAACASGDDAAPDQVSTASTAATEPTSAMAFPDPDWKETTPAEADLDVDGIEAAREIAERSGSHCLAVTRHGELVGTWDFGSRSGDAVPWLTMTHALVSMVVGAAQSDGFLDIDDPVSQYVPSWRGTDRDQVTIRNVMAQDSGLADSDEIERGFGQSVDTTEYAVNLDQASERGTVFAFSLPSVQVLEAVLDGALSATGQSSSEFAHARVLEPLELGGEWATDRADNLDLNIGYTGVCDDALRVGNLALAEGRWKDDQLIDREFLVDATRGPGQALNESFGLLWWRNSDGGWLDGEGVERDGLFYPGVPVDMFLQDAAGGQTIAVFPSSGVVIARLAPIQAEVEGDPFLEILQTIAASVAS